VTCFVKALPALPGLNEASLLNFVLGLQRQLQQYLLKRILALHKAVKLWTTQGK